MRQSSSTMISMERVYETRPAFELTLTFVWLLGFSNVAVKRRGLSGTGKCNLPSACWTGAVNEGE